jgi:hypothetical protein
VSPLTTVTLEPHPAAKADDVVANMASSIAARTNNCKNFLAFIETSISLIKNTMMMPQPRQKFPIFAPAKIL